MTAIVRPKPYHPEVTQILHRAFLVCVVLSGSPGFVNGQAVIFPEPPAAARPPLEKTGTGVRPSDLSFLPPDCDALFAIRPALIAKDPRRDALNRDLMTLLADSLPILDEGGRLIDQVVATYDAKVESGRDVGLLSATPNCLVVRSTVDIDWKQRVAALLERWGPAGSTLNQRLIEGHACYKPSTKRFTILRPGECYYFPDTRTLVIAPEGTLQLVLRKAEGNDTRLVDEDGWRAVQSCPVAFAVRNGTFADLANATSPREDACGVVSGIRLLACQGIGQFERLYCGLDNLDSLEIHTIAVLPSARQAALAGLQTFAYEAGLAAGVWLDRQGLLGARVVDPPQDSSKVLARTLLDTASKRSRIRLNDRIIELKKKTRISLAELQSAG